MNTTLRDGMHWVGHIDWTVRTFHGYVTERGSTYNAYLVQDEKPALIDTVKAPYAEALLEHIAAHLPPERIACVVCNHAEPDHSSALPQIMQACPNAELICDARCRQALARQYPTADWRFRVVKDGDSVSIGRRTLTFLETPMVHWPESMFTYVPEEKLLFSMDAFGQHYACSQRFDDEAAFDEVMAEAKTYYANILMPYGKPIARQLERAKGLAIDMIAPAHGVIWRARPDAILGAYAGWVTQRPAAKVLVIYDTMWHSTEKMAGRVLDGALACDVDARLYDLRATNLTVLAAEILDTAAVAFGSPTLNTTLMPQMGALLAYLKGLKPRGKCAVAFGSYGWSRGGARDLHACLQDIGFEILREPIECRYAPGERDLTDCREAGRSLARRAREIADQT